MQPTLRFGPKAAKYARYRWDYAPEAVQAVIAMARLNPASAIADIGSGTGILTRHFVRRSLHVYAVEPDAEMRRHADLALQPCAGFHSVTGCAEATTLPDRSVDLITVAHALHWFEPEAARREFRRILKPGGWLAVFSNRGTDPELGEALRLLRTAENGWDVTPATLPNPPASIGFYYDCERPLPLSFPQVRQETWDEFFGALCSDSSAPVESHPRFANLEKAARAVFDRLAIGGRLRLAYETELYLGRMPVE